MKEEKKNKNEENMKIKTDAQTSGDLDDFIFGDEGYRCSER